MRQTIFAHASHRYIWLPLFEATVLPYLLTTLILIGISWAGLGLTPAIATKILSMPLLVVPSTLAILLLSTQICTYKAYGYYYRYVSAWFGTAAFITLLFALFFGCAVLFSAFTATSPIPATTIISSVGGADDINNNVNTILVYAALGTFVTAATSSYFPPVRTEIWAFGSKLVKLVSLLETPLELKSRRVYREVEQLVGDCIDSLDKVLHLSLPPSSETAATQLNKALVEFKRWLSVHDAALVNVGGPTVGQLTGFRDKLSGDK